MSLGDGTSTVEVSEGAGTSTVGTSRGAGPCPAGNGDPNSAGAPVGTSRVEASAVARSCPSGRGGSAGAGGGSWAAQGPPHKQRGGNPAEGAPGHAAPPP